LTSTCVVKIKYIMYNVQDNSVLYNNDVRPVICEGWHFTLMWKTLAWLHHFTKRWDLVSYFSFNSANFYWSACTKPVTWAVMYFNGISFASLQFLYSITDVFPKCGIFLNILPACLLHRSESEPSCICMLRDIWF
jgi:hypothetical protein